MAAAGAGGFDVGASGAVESGLEECVVEELEESQLAVYPLLELLLPGEPVEGVALRTEESNDVLVWARLWVAGAVGEFRSYEAPSVPSHADLAC